MSTRPNDVRGGGHGAHAGGTERTHALPPSGEGTPGRRDDSLHREAVRAYEEAKAMQVTAMRGLSAASHEHCAAQRAVESDPSPSAFLRVKVAAFEYAVARARSEAAQAWVNGTIEGKAATERRS